LDFTGILAAGSVAVLGFLILPARRRRAKRELADRLESLRKNLVKAMEDAFEKEQKNSLQRLRESIAPYTRFVRSEQQKLARVTEEIDGILAELARIKLQIDEI
ncbi:MAG: dynamin, partial [Clostridiaceae bacterium]|nr:dynamin [Clostridiaceae bacterium]